MGSRALGPDAFLLREFVFLLCFFFAGKIKAIFRIKSVSWFIRTRFNLKRIKKKYILGGRESVITIKALVYWGT